MVDTASSDAGTPSDKRFRVPVSMLRETFGAKENSKGDGCKLRWCNTHQMLGDGLTKWSVGGAIIGSAAIQVLMKGARHLVPAGRSGRTAAVAATLAGRICTAGGSQVLAPFDDDAEESVLADRRVWIMLAVFALCFQPLGSDHTGGGASPHTKRRRAGTSLCSPVRAWAHRG